ncbi:MAG: mechanosensitive ion channel family protein, partial [Pseudomonadota bacterium]
MQTPRLHGLLVVTTLSFALGWIPFTAMAVEEKAASPTMTEPAKEAADQSTEPLNEALANIEKQRETIKELEQRATRSTGLIQKAYERRIDRAWLSLLEQGVSFAELVSAQGEAGVDVSEYKPRVIDILSSQAEIAKTVAKRYRERIEIPDAGLSAAEKAAAYTKVFAMLESVNHTYAVFAKSLKLSQDFGVDTNAQEALLKENLRDRAANGSILLEMATTDVEALRAGVSAMPDDAELKAKLTVATSYVRNLAQALGELLDVMDGLGMDTAAYHEQVLSATGEITTDVFEVGVITNLLLGWGQTLWDVIIQDGPDLIFKVILFLIIVYAFSKLARIVERVVQGALARSHLQFSELLRRMVVSIVRNIIIIFGVLIALSQMGISLGPLLAGLGVVGFVVGFALQDLLSNFASGVMILLYR